MKRNYYCVMLGAGASADAGVPTSAQLVSDFLAQCSASAKRQIAEIVSSLDTSQANVEEIALVARSAAPDLYRRLRSFVMRSVADHKNCRYLRALYSLDLDGLHGVTFGGVPVWRAIRNREAVPSATTTRIFSLNYDTTVEDALAESDPYLELFGWDYERKRYVYSPGVTYDDASGTFKAPTRPGDQKRYRIPRNGIYKLHGSINWAWRDSQSGLELVPNRKSTSRISPEVIFAEPEKLRITPPYNNLFYAFSRSLLGCQALIVIGYSWSDSHINKIIEHQIARGMKIMEVSLFGENPRSERPFFPDEAVFIRSRARPALLGRSVQVCYDSDTWSSVEGGLVGVVQQCLHTQLWKTEEEWEEYRRRKSQQSDRQ